MVSLFPVVELCLAQWFLSFSFFSLSSLRSLLLALSLKSQVEMLCRRSGSSSDVVAGGRNSCLGIVSCRGSGSHYQRHFLMKTSYQKQTYETSDMD